MPHVAPYGTWESPLSAGAIAAAALRLGAVSIDGDDVYWLEGRPAEGGRYALVRRGRGGVAVDALPPEFNVRSRVHEYGGGAYAVANGTIVFVNFADQRIYIGGSASRNPPYETGSAPNAREPEPRASSPESRAPLPITPAGDWRYADIAFDLRRQRLICVREDHTGGGREPVNTLVSIPLATGPAEVGDQSAGEVLVTGDDFYSTPRLSPDGSRLSWLSWRHPRMPWDGTELWVARVTADGLRDRMRIAGGERESIYQPGWSPDGELWYASDRGGWWELYRAPADDPQRAKRAVSLPGAELGRPEWVFGTATWAFASPDRLVVSYTRQGRWHLATADPETGAVADIAPELQPHEWLAASATHAVLVAGSATRPDAVVRVRLDDGGAEILQSASTLQLEQADVSAAEPIEFTTTGGTTAHAFYYAPRNGAFTGPDAESPPLIVITHGGPTSAAKPTLDLSVQFWTTRGFAVVDVNYGGSSGFGRAYRERLNGAWGVVDVADVISAASFLVDGGRADPRRLIVRGGSAGGYTTLAALAFHPGVFKAGASYYGVSDLEVLELDTHKFESRYSHSLIGPYPERRDLYRARSPIHHVDRLACPLILFQGLEDKVVPPNQSEMMADAVRAKGLPVAYLAFEGEQHGFRRADTIVRSLEAELYFYGAVFGFTPAGAIPPIEIANIHR